MKSNEDPSYLNPKADPIIVWTVIFSLTEMVCHVLLTSGSE